MAILDLHNSFSKPELPTLRAPAAGICCSCCQRPLAKASAGVFFLQFISPVAVLAPRPSPLCVGVGVLLALE